jgi:hypothetical protein
MTHEQTDMEALERIVELHGLRSTLAVLANVCAEKVEHQDEQAAKLVPSLWGYPHLEKGRCEKVPPSSLS